MWKSFISGALIGLAFSLLVLPRILHDPLPALEELPLVHAVEMAVAPQPITILAFGDLMLDRVVRQDIDAQGPMYPFEKIAPELAGRDIVVANAEGIFSDNQSVSVSNHSELDFTFATSTLPALKSLGFTVLSQANNHALNFGWSGLQQSKQWIAESGIDSFGDPENSNPGPLYVEVRGVDIAFVGYDQFSSSGGDASSTLAAIGVAHARGAFVIVYPHWGVEYNEGTTTLQESLAHQFVDAGADAVLGSHPHVVEPIEIYKQKAIFYSMGNFIFDQSWDAAVSHGIGVEITLTPSAVTYATLPFAIDHAQAEPEGSSTSFSLPR